MTEIIRSPDTETYQASNRSTVAQWMHDRLEVFCTHAVKPLTLASYESIFRNYISLRIGAMQLQEVRGTHIQRIFNDMIADGSSAKTVKNVAAVLHKSLSVALKQWLIQQNPCDATGMPKAQKPEIQLLSDSEIPVFLSACAQDAMGRAFVLCLLAGLREGECMGLSWNDVDSSSGRITVRQQLQKEKRRAENTISLRQRAQRSGC